MHFKYYKYIVFFLTVSIIGCNRTVEEAATEEHHHDEEENVVELTEAQMKVGGVTVGTLEEKQISGTIRVNGILDVPPQQLVSVSAPLGGFLKNTSLLEGSHVKKGEVIATIENIDFIQIQQDYLDAKSNLDFAKADYDRQQSLAKENVNSEKTLQQSKTNYSSWYAKYTGLKEKLRVLNLDPSAVEAGNLKSSINLFSPIHGYVTEVNVNIGKFVSPTDVLFEIVDTEHLHAELIIFEKDIAKIQLGQKVRFTLANETTERMATVYLIGREISKDRTVQIHCHIDREDKELLPGMYLNGLVEAGQVKVPALADAAIVDYQGKKYIFIEVQDDHKEKEEAAHEEETQHFEMVEVEIGNTELGFTEVKSSNMEKLKSAKIVINGAYALLSKMKNSEEEGGHVH